MGREWWGKSAAGLVMEGEGSGTGSHSLAYEAAAASWSSGDVFWSSLPSHSAGSCVDVPLSRVLRNVCSTWARMIARSTWRASAMSPSSASSPGCSWSTCRSRCASGCFVAGRRGSWGRGKEGERRGRRRQLCIPVKQLCLLVLSQERGPSPQLSPKLGVLLPGMACLGGWVAACLQNWPGAYSQGTFGDGASPSVTHPPPPSLCCPTAGRVLQAAGVPGSAAALCAAHQAAGCGGAPLAAGHLLT